MEKKLLKYIMNPSFILTFVTGTVLVLITRQYNEKWFVLKFYWYLQWQFFICIVQKLERISITKQILKQINTSES